MLKENQPIALTPEVFARAFPFHIAFDRDMRVTQLGHVLQRLCPRIGIGQRFDEHFRIKRPRVATDYASVAAQATSLFILEAHASTLMLKGQMLIVPEDDRIVFLGSPWLTSIEQAEQLGLDMGDFAIHDPIADYLFLLQTKNNALAEASTLAAFLEQQHQELRSRNQELWESQQRYRSVVDSVNEVVFQTDESGNWTFLNRAWAEITGYSVAESVGATCMSFMHPEDRPRSCELFRPLIEGKKDFCRHEVRILTKAGQVRWAEVGARATRDDANQIVGTSGTLTDVTERRLAEAALRESENRFQAFMNHSPTPAYIIDTEGRLVYVNEPLVRHFGVQKADLLGKKLAELCPVEFGTKSLTQGWPSSANGQLMGVEEIVPRPDGRSATWLSFMFPLVESGGQRFLACIAIDITERKYYEKQLEEYQLRLEAAVIQMERLAYTDLLTGVPNRGAFQRRLEDEIERARRYHLPLSLIMLDVDHFKQFNDTYGHPAGDEVLKTVAQLLQHQARFNDQVARYGGEEFIILLVNMPSEGAYIMAERLRRSIETAPWTHRRVTASVGVATFDWETMDGSRLISTADNALYLAKANGRNRVVQAK